MSESEFAKMLRGEHYNAAAPDIQAAQSKAALWLARYNGAATLTAAERWRLLDEQLAAVGDGVVIQPPFYCDYGSNITIGCNVFLNFNCVILDVVAVSIGDRTQIGPGVQILAADHPRDPVQRRAGLEFGREIHIGGNVWIGGGALILPGVTIGDDAVIGAGSVVTRNVPVGAIVAGNPARTLTSKKTSR